MTPRQRTLIAEIMALAAMVVPIIAGAILMVWLVELLVRLVSR
jgi:hypothetical protein